MMGTQGVIIGSIGTPQLGEVWVAFSERGLVAVEFRVRRPQFESNVRLQTHDDIVPPDSKGARLVSDAACQIAEYLDGKRRVFDIPIDWSILGSDFQRAALKAVMAVPYGEIRTYAQIAAQMGCPRAPRAVGRANATNPMPLVIPCHRILGSDGRLHGYGGYGGLKTKLWLLDLEGAPVPQPARAELRKSAA